MTADEGSPSTQDPVPGAESEVLAWGVVANVSRDVVVRQRQGRKRPGTRHFAPGAKVWVLPVRWGDGGADRYVIGTARGTGGRRLIRVVMPSDRLVNYRVRAVYSPAVYRAMIKDLDRRQVPLYKSANLADLYSTKEEAEHVADAWRWGRTRGFHLRRRPWDAAHRADEDCEFCDGRDAFQAGLLLNENPLEDLLVQRRGSNDWWESSHGVWAAGWRSESQMAAYPYDDEDLVIRIITDVRRQLRSDAERLAQLVRDKSVDLLESDNQLRYGEATVRFIRSDYQPRRVDGIVHAWLDDDEVVQRTQFS